MDSETALLYARNRYFVSAAGRFIRRDSLLTLRPPHRYGYAAANPVNLVDYEGLDVAAPNPAGYNCELVTHLAITTYHRYLNTKGTHWGPIEGAKFLGTLGKKGKACADQAAELMDRLNRIPNIDKCFTVQYGFYGFSMQWAGHVWVRLEGVGGHKGYSMDPYFSSNVVDLSNKYPPIPIPKY